MVENAAEWECIARRLIHDQLAYHAAERLEQAFMEVAEDIENGHEVTVEHLRHLAHAFNEVLCFIRECIVPLVDDLDELSTKFELEARPEPTDN